MASKSEKDYQAEDDHRTLSRAEEVRGDKSRMAGVKRHHAKVAKAHKAIGRSIAGKRQMSGGYIAVDDPPGTAPLPPGKPVPAKVGGGNGRPSPRPPATHTRTAARRKASKRPLRKGSR